MQAIMLAAGKGSRLGKYTKNNTKCMLDVHGETLLERAIDALLEAGIKDFILVLGYKKDNVKKFIKEKELDKKINITYVDNDVYDTTNNIYDIEYKNKVIVIGNEANGVSKEVQNIADKKVKIPMLGKTESLNAAVATSIMIYEYVRRTVL